MLTTSEINESERQLKRNTNKIAELRLTLDGLERQTETLKAVLVVAKSPDYEPESDIIECEIYSQMYDEDHYKKRYRGMDGQLFPMDVMPDGYILFGFKFKGIKQVINKDFGYSHNGVDILPFADYDNIKSGKDKVLHATHILFKKAE